MNRICNTRNVIVNENISLYSSYYQKKTQQGSIICQRYSPEYNSHKENNRRQRIFKEYWYSSLRMILMLEYSSHILLFSWNLIEV
ncbi:hypothetical protein Avbf_16295 [Armadillidium vulgare]|nr:hypothetical protein Avbf_16295 [Armadillidium vulgare]